MQYSMVFDEKRPDDLAGEMHGVSVLVDPFSAQYIRGAVVDFSDSLTAGGFNFSNPNASQSCGCRKSFTAYACSQPWLNTAVPCHAERFSYENYEKHCAYRHPRTDCFHRQPHS